MCIRLSRYFYKPFELHMKEEGWKVLSPNVCMKSGRQFLGMKNNQEPIGEGPILALFFPSVPVFLDIQHNKLQTAGP